MLEPPEEDDGVPVTNGAVGAKEVAVTWPIPTTAWRKIRGRKRIKVENGKVIREIMD